MDNNRLSDKLISLRKSKGLTQKELAKEVNYSDKVISKWERGESTPNIDALKILSVFYNITIDELVSNEIKETKIETDTNTIEVKVIKGPSILLKLSILIPFIAVIVSLFFSIQIWIISMLVLLFYLIIYAFLISYITFEATYKGNIIKVVNRPRHLGLYINDNLVDVNTALLSFSTKLSGVIGDKKIKVSISFNFFVKCTVFVE